MILIDLYSYLCHPLVIHMDDIGKTKWRTLSRENCMAARRRWPNEVNTLNMCQLRILTRTYGLSIASGDLIVLNSAWYVTHTGLLNLAHRSGCQGIHVEPVPEFSNATDLRWTFKASVYKSTNCRGFAGYGDADPSNVCSQMHGAELRIAETRAVNRALRKAYGIGICSVEELGSSGGSAPSTRESKKLPPQPANGNYGGPEVRDRLCQIIRQRQLDPTLVKAYATEFCGTKTLREATREQVENFVQHLADWAQKDRDALLCQLNSYLGSKEGAA
jgi:hypothetical protein